MVKSLIIYLGDNVRLAVLREAGGPRAVGSQFGHYHSGRIGGHCASGEETRRGASAERRRPAGTCRIRSNTAADSCLSRVTGRARRPVMA